MADRWRWDNAACEWWIDRIVSPMSERPRSVPPSRIPTNVVNRFSGCTITEYRYRVNEYQHWSAKPSAWIDQDGEEYTDDTDAPLTYYMYANDVVSRHRYWSQHQKHPHLQAIRDTRRRNKIIGWTDLRLGSYESADAMLYMYVHSLAIAAYVRQNDRDLSRIDTSKIDQATKESYIEAVFGGKAKIRYRSPCWNCVALTKYGERDIFYCLKHQSGANNRDQILVLVARRSDLPDDEEVRVWSWDITFDMTVDAKVRNMMAHAEAPANDGRQPLRIKHALRQSGARWYIHALKTILSIRGSLPKRILDAMDIVPLMSHIAYNAEYNEIQYLGKTRAKIGTSFPIAFTKPELESGLGMHRPIFDEREPDYNGGDDGA